VAQAIIIVVVARAFDWYTNPTPYRPVTSITMATQDAEAKELALVGKVEMRIALASSEKKLEDLLKLYLAPLLLKLGSDHGAVRNKVGNSHVSSVYEASVVHARTLLIMAFPFRSSPFVNTSTLASSHSTHLQALT
jgi:hypothetical protein